MPPGRISIHAPREGSDLHPWSNSFCLMHFYPRSPRGERPAGGSRNSRYPGISIHAPREGSDVRGPMLCHRSAGHFYPRSPLGERLYSDWLRIPRSIFLSTLPARGATSSWRLNQGEAAKFLSTLPARGATRGLFVGVQLLPISIHAPREGSDLGRPPPPGWQYNFYPRSPRGERHSGSN